MQSALDHSRSCSCGRPPYLAARRANPLHLRPCVYVSAPSEYDLPPSRGNVPGGLFPGSFLLATITRVIAGVWGMYRARQVTNAWRTSAMSKLARGCVFAHGFRRARSAQRRSPNAWNLDRREAREVDNPRLREGIPIMPAARPEPRAPPRASP